MNKGGQSRRKRKGTWLVVWESVETLYSKNVQQTFHPTITTVHSPTIEMAYLIY